MHDRFMNQRAKNGEAYLPTTYEHIANVATHGSAVVPAFFYCRNLIKSAADDVEYLNALLFGTAAISLFLSSTVYHSVSFAGKWTYLQKHLHKVDRATIYIFIAASYTPWLFLKQVGPIGTQMRWIIWVLAVLGISYQYLYHERYKLIETLFYVFIGVVPALIVVYSMVERSGLQLLAYGGISYMVGVIFFKCDGVIPYAHAIWHLHVFAGATFHYYAIHTYLMGRCNSLGLPETTKITYCTILSES